MASTDIYCGACGAANQTQDAYCIACGRPLRTSTFSMQYPTQASTSGTRTGFLTFNHMLKQRYRIREQLGQGGFGAVYKAEDTQFGNRLVAVKEMSQRELKTKQEIAEATDAFKREALMLAGLRHQNLPRIYDHFSDGGRWYLVMDYIEGETLSDHLDKARGHLPVEESLQIGIQLCTVLDYLHTRQPPIIFRDLTPNNIMLTPDGHLYLIDFGIARLFKPGQVKDTTAFGTLGYAAPELLSKQTTPRSDIYSLGAILHQMLTGSDPTQTPFRFASPRSSGNPAHVRFSTLIMQMLNMDEHKRPASMSVVKQQLQSIVTVLSDQLRSPMLRTGGGISATPTTVAVRTPTIFPPASHVPNRGTKIHGRTLLIGALGVILVIGLIFAFSHQTLSNNNLNQIQNAPVSQNQPTIATPTPLISTLPAIWQGVLNGCGSQSTCKVQLKITTLNPDNTFAGEWLNDYNDGAGFSNIEWITGSINQDQITWQGTGRSVGSIVSNCSYSGIINNDGSISGQVLYGCGGTFTIYK